MLTSAICFATMGACVHWLGESMHWSIITFFRMFLSLLILLALAPVRNIPIILNGPPALWVRSAAGSIGMLCNFYAMTLLPISDALAMLHTAPIWIALFRRVIYRDTFGLPDWLLTIGAVAGIFLAESSTFAVAPVGIAVALLGAIFAACAFISMGFLSSLRAESVTMHFALFGALAAAGFILIGLPGSVDGFPPIPLHAGGLLLTAVLGTVAQIFLTLGLSRGNTVLMSLIGLSQVIFGGLFDWLVWDHTFTFKKLAGFALVGLCVALMTIRHSPARAGEKTA